MDLLTLLSKNCDDDFEDDESQKIRKYLGRSKIPFFRNLVRPVGEFYSPIYFDKDCVKRNVRMRNLYRILESTDDYAIGVHVQESLRFISFKNFLVVDYDTPARLKILFEFCRYNKDYLFRYVKTRKGYHVFLMNKRIEHDSLEAYDLLQRLGTDNMYMMGVLVHGFSIRLNQKDDDEKDNYIEKGIVGSGQEDPELFRLYKYYLELFGN